jgi:hypothetical protein
MGIECQDSRRVGVRDLDIAFRFGVDLCAVMSQLRASPG